MFFGLFIYIWFGFLLLLFVLILNLDFFLNYGCDSKYGIFYYVYDKYYYYYNKYNMGLKKKGINIILGIIFKFLKIFNIFNIFNIF